MTDLAELTSEGEVSDGSVSGGSYPGTALRQGSSGKSVEQLQFWLNNVATYNSTIPRVTQDGSFGTATAAAVTAFQTAYGLGVDGIVGRATWDALYAAYADIESDLGEAGGAYPGTPLRQGSTGSAVRQVQFWLRVAADGTTALRPVTVDGSFGAATRQAVVDFQEYRGLTADGVVGQATWNALYRFYLLVVNDLLPPGQRPGEYPGTLRRGSSGTAVRELQYYLYQLAAYYTGVPSVEIDGMFGTGTENAVRAWQRLAGLTVDGVVGPASWASIVAGANGLATSGPTVTARAAVYPGTALALGSTLPETADIRQNLALIAYWLPAVQAPGDADFFDDTLADSVESFQREAGLPVTGIVDEATWDAIRTTWLALLAGGPTTESETDPAAYPGTGLAPDSAGPAVLQVQLWLNLLAQKYCASDFVPENGIYGSETEAAVRQFQQQYGLPDTGTVDRPTWDLLALYANETTEEA